MPQEIEITDNQVRLAEKHLLPQGKSFDEERINFIKDLSTHDLHAVPGSGKTTALLAKLIALEQHLPFADRSGVLVISHTNAAVDEIKQKIGHICPRLFAYPNFIGT
ncbi:UvrD-helicase domain-containing protein, partial [Algoriphagus sp.]